MSFELHVFKLPPNSLKINMAKKTKKSEDSHFVIIHRALIRDERISDGAYRLYCYLVDRRNKKHDGLVWVNQSTMANDLHLSIPSIVKRLDVLEEVGLVMADKLKFWPESGDRVIGRNKLCYKVLPTSEFYSPEELKENWNSEPKKKATSKPKSSDGTKQKVTLVTNAKVALSSIEQEQVEQELAYQEIGEHSPIERELISENILLEEGTIINNEESLVLIHFERELKKYGRYSGLPIEYNKNDIKNIRYAVNRFGFQSVIESISYALKNWTDLELRYDKLLGTSFGLRTLGSGWLDVIEDERRLEQTMRTLDKKYSKNEKSLVAADKPNH